MKKKILIVIVAVAMMIPLLAVGVCADYSPETGWSEPDIIVDEPFPIFVRKIEDAVEVDTFTLFRGCLISPYMETLDPSKLPLGVDVLPRDYEWYFAWEDNQSQFIAYRAKGFWISGSGTLYTKYNISGDDWVESQINPATLQIWAVLFDSYPPPATEAGLQFFSAFEFGVALYKDPTRSPFLTLIELMFDNFSRIIGGLAAGVTGAFTALIWENPEATEKTLSTAAKFIFTIAGLSIGMTVFYMVLRLIRFGRQR